ncbi:DUF2461 domain-containing protein [Reichenbachiella agarivorans]|uniref:DUF2461 domain-containing protein n=1 Tax=Reichenbachiella agarivorans TaxID=2979464 RepID=A0ABY6CRU0_9BACT|nr:DUF2461 domain-containing protein [Reichenbachiella agarivorans]UXP33232.1 DUF2461 domain-containing protein [Reichenbachiella agarivorans]
MELDAILSFLRDLRVNNNKEWFDLNRKEYERCRGIFLKFLQQFIEGIAEIDPAISGVDPKKCVFRINRDIRFGHDKTPYKTNFGALIGEMGKKTEGTGYYIHLSPGENFVGGGIYKPQPETLAKIRQEIDYNPMDLKNIIDTLSFKSTFGEIRGEQLKTAPKGYPKDHAFIDLLRLKSFYVIKKYSDEEIGTEVFLKEALKTAQEASKFNAFLKNAIN